MNVEIRATRKENNKYQTSNFYDQTYYFNNKIITKSNLHQIKTERNNLTYTSLEKIWDIYSMRLVNMLTKKSKEVRSKIRFHY